MNRICTQCNTQLVEDCEVHVKGAMYGLKIKKPGRFFSKASVEAKAAVCPSCGLVQLYVDQPNAFLKT